MHRQTYYFWVAFTSNKTNLPPAQYQTALSTAFSLSSFHQASKNKAASPQTLIAHFDIRIEPHSRSSPLPPPRSPPDTSQSRSSTHRPCSSPCSASIHSLETPNETSVAIAAVPEASSPPAPAWPRNTPWRSRLHASRPRESPPSSLPPRYPAAFASTRTTKSRNWGRRTCIC